MESFNVFGLIIRRWPVIVVLTAVVFLASLAVYLRREPSVSGSLSVTVQAEKVYPATSQLILQGDGAALTQTLVATTQSWLADPSYVRAALSGADVGSDDKSLKDLAKVFKVVVQVPNSATYQIQYTGSDEREVRAVFDSLRAELDGLSAQYNQGYAGEARLRLLYSEPTISLISSGLPLTPIAGLLAGLILSLVVAALTERRK